MSQHLRATGVELARGDPRVWRALLAAHIADQRGRCRACRWASLPADIWPCSLWHAAEHARRRCSQP